MTAHVQDLIAVKPTRRSAKLIWTWLAVAALAVVVVAVVVVVMSTGSHHAQQIAPADPGANRAGNIPVTTNCLPGRVVRPC